MGELADPTAQQVTVESWIWYSIGITLIILRLWSRSIVVGSVKRLQFDDYLMIFGGCIYTVLIVAINISSRWQTNLYAPGEEETFSPKEIKDRIYGSKIVILTEQSMLVCIWTIKTCLLWMYSRLSARLVYEKIIRAIGLYVAMGFVASELAWFVNCRPFHGYWAVPPPSSQCATYHNYLIVQMVFNISSDLLILGVAISLVARARVEAKKKAILIAVFSCGVFVIICAFLNKLLNFLNPDSTIYMLWDVREASVAVYVANLPLLWPLVRKVCNVGSFAEGSSRSRSRGYAPNSEKWKNRASRFSQSSRLSLGRALGMNLSKQLHSPKPDGDTEMGAMGGNPNGERPIKSVLSQHSQNDSETHIVKRTPEEEVDITDQEALHFSTRLSFHLHHDRSTDQVSLSVRPPSDQPQLYLH